MLLGIRAAMLAWPSTAEISETLADRAIIAGVCGRCVKQLLALVDNLTASVGSVDFLEGYWPGMSQKRKRVQTDAVTAAFVEQDKALDASRSKRPPPAQGIRHIGHLLCAKDASSEAHLSSW